MISDRMCLANISAVFLAGDGNNWSVVKMIVQFFFLIIVFVGVLYLAYLSTKLVAKAKLNVTKGSNIKVIESVLVAGQASLQLIKVGSQFFLISISKDNVSFLTEVKPDDIIEDKPYREEAISFESYLKDYISKFKKKK